MTAAELEVKKWGSFLWPGLTGRNKWGYGATAEVELEDVGNEAARQEERRRSREMMYGGGEGGHDDGWWSSVRGMRHELKADHLLTVEDSGTENSSFMNITVFFTETFSVQWPFSAFVIFVMFCLFVFFLYYFMPMFALGFDKLLNLFSFYNLCWCSCCFFVERFFVLLSMFFDLVICLCVPLCIFFSSIFFCLLLLVLIGLRFSSLPISFFSLYLFFLFLFFSPFLKTKKTKNFLPLISPFVGLCKVPAFPIFFLIFCFDPKIATNCVWTSTTHIVCLVLHWSRKEATNSCTSGHR